MLLPISKTLEMCGKCRNFVWNYEQVDFIMWLVLFMESL
jgi:hypothetical protein